MIAVQRPFRSRLERDDPAGRLIGDHRDIGPETVEELGRGLERGGTDQGRDASAANLVRILHDDGTWAEYAHLNRSTIRVRPGDVVERGEYIADSGNTGFSSGPHLHFVVQRNAGYLDNLSRMPWDGFAASTESEKSRALPAVWKEADKFKEAASRFENEAAKLYQASRGGDEAAVKAQIGAVGKTCGGCHDNFRQKQ